MLAEKKICYLFNKFFSSLLKDLKSMDDGLKSIVKKYYKVVDKSSEEYYEYFWNAVQPKFHDFLNLQEAVEEQIMVVGDIEIVKSMTIGSILEVISQDNLDAFWNYIYTLIVFAYLYHESKNASEGEKEGIEALFMKIVIVLSKLQHGESVENEIADILDDDVRTLVSKVKVSSFGVESEDVKAAAEEAMATEDGEDKSSEFMRNIDNSKIGELAREISKDIDISKMNIEKPEDIGKLLDFSGSNSFLGDIVGKVSSKLTEKIANGDIKQEELMSEAMSMMSMLNGGGSGGGIADILKNMGGLGDMMNNPMVSEMMKASKKGNVQMRNSGGARKGVTSTRDRLRKKLAEKKKQEEESCSQP